jgi:hypothetical protein
VAMSSDGVREWRGKVKILLAQGAQGGAMEYHEAARAHPSCGLVEAERWWSGASSVSSGKTTMAENKRVF